MNTQALAGVTTARWLGYTGLIPFVAGGALALTSDGALRDLAVRAVIGYGAVIVSFPDDPSSCSSATRVATSLTTSSRSLLNQKIDGSSADGT